MTGIGRPTLAAVGTLLLSSAALGMTACGSQQPRRDETQTASPAEPDRSRPVDPQRGVTEQTPQGAVGTAGGGVNPDAVRALERMGAYLRSLKAFQVTSETSRDDVLDDGQKIDLDGVVNMLVRLPDGLRAEVSNDRQHRLYFYDGKSFTLWGQRVNYYATVDAPSTLDALIDNLDQKYGIELPLVDLFYWGSDRKSGKVLTSALVIGPSQIGGVSCGHYAFRQEDLDWQIWIQQGQFPLPRKLIVTTRTDEARPEFTSVMTWNLAPAFNDAAFTFTPPKDARRITFAALPTGSN
jgi:hypothetical protein